MSLARVSPAARVDESAARAKVRLVACAWSELTVKFTLVKICRERQLNMQIAIRILRPTLSARPLVQATVAFGLLLLFGFSPTGLAQPSDPPLNFFKNYIVTGDSVVGGVGLRGLGDVTGFATGTINIPDTANYPNAKAVPPGADIVAALLYWQTVE